MSHDAAWRDSCASTRRDKRWRWLWRLVSPLVHGTDEHQFASLMPPDRQTPRHYRRYQSSRENRRSDELFPQASSSALLRWNGCAMNRARSNCPSRRSEIALSMSRRFHRRASRSIRIEYSMAWSFWLTSKMSHGARWRDSCASTRRDSERRWLWRLVRRFCHFAAACKTMPPTIIAA